MKITQLRLDNFQQFNPLTLNFTYPKGHEKAGQPLDKVCFIGQSGTGKTTILNLIQDFISELNYAYRKKANLGLELGEFFFGDRTIGKNGVYFNAFINHIKLTTPILSSLVQATAKEQTIIVKELLQSIGLQKRLSIYLPAELIEYTSYKLFLMN